MDFNVNLSSIGRPCYAPYPYTNSTAISIGDDVEHIFWIRISSSWAGDVNSCPLQNTCYPPKVPWMVPPPRPQARSRGGGATVLSREKLLRGATRVSATATWLLASVCAMLWAPAGGSSPTLVVYSNRGATTASSSMLLRRHPEQRLSPTKS